MNGGLAGLVLTLDATSAPAAFSVWDPTTVQAHTVLSAGNATATITAGNDGIAGTRSHAYGSGPWSFAVTISSVDANVVVGVGTSSAVAGGLYPGGNNNGFGYYGINGHKLNNPTDAAYGASYTSGDVIGVLLAVDGKVTFYKNGASQGVAFDLAALGFSSTSTTWFPMFGSGTGSAGARAGTIDTSAVLGGGPAWG